MALTIGERSALVETLEERLTEAWRVQRKERYSERKATLSPSVN